MWALHVLQFAGIFPGAEQHLASEVLSPLRIRKSAAEVQALREAGQAIDRVHARVPQWLRPGTTERQVGAKIAEAILGEGHVQVDFVIVGSGPNAASPHHEVSDRVIQQGDVVVVDIGGTMPSGYCSDCTRTYAIGEPPADFTKYYAVLKDAQDQACDAAGPGVQRREVDRVARGIIADAGYGDWFIHRTGHGIGLESHEDPYIVEGNAIALEPGMAFSIEPGIYPGPHGARIEDIVVCTETGHERLNNAPTRPGDRVTGNQRSGESPPRCCSARNCSNCSASSSAVGICSPSASSSPSATRAPRRTAARGPVPARRPQRTRRPAGRSACWSGRRPRAARARAGRAR